MDRALHHAHHDDLRLLAPKSSKLVCREAHGGPRRLAHGDASCVSGGPVVPPRFAVRGVRAQRCVSAVTPAAQRGGARRFGRGCPGEPVGSPSELGGRTTAAPRLTDNPARTKGRSIHERSAVPGLRRAPRDGARRFGRGFSAESPAPAWRGPARRRRRYRVELAYAAGEACAGGLGRARQSCGQHGPLWAALPRLRP